LYLIHIQGGNTGDPFTTDVKIIRRKIKAIGKNKSVGPDRVSGEILKLGGEAMISYLARLLDTTMNNAPFWHPLEVSARGRAPLATPQGRPWIKTDDCNSPLAVVAAVTAVLAAVSDEYIRSIWLPVKSV
jgi:hypothetical protein